jgi:alpha-tubulin suppressor-like RCC1 family protein
MSTTTLLLIDSRLPDVSGIVNSLLPNADYVMFDYDTDTLESLSARITKSYDIVSIAQHNYGLPAFRLLDSMQYAILNNVASMDPSIATWKPLVAFFAWLHTHRSVQIVDLLACDVWASADWRYAISKIQRHSGVHIRASVNITGKDGDFILESHNVNLIGLYFSANIVNYPDAFYYGGNGDTGLIGVINLPTNLPVPGGTLLNTAYNDFTGANANISKTDYYNIVRIYTNSYGGSAALDKDGKLYTYGDANSGGDSSDVSANLLSGVIDVIPSAMGFAALKSDGTAVSWGKIKSVNLSVTTGPMKSHRSVTLTNCVSVVSSPNGFAALKNNGSVVTWGYVANWPGVPSNLLQNVVKLVGGIGTYDFFALRSGGEVVFWGSTGYVSFISPASTSPIVDIWSADTKCLLVRQDGTIYESMSNTLVYTIPAGIHILEVATAPGGQYMIRFSDFSAFTNVNGPYQYFNNVTQFIANSASFAYIQSGAVRVGGDTRFGGSFTHADGGILHGDASGGVARLFASSQSIVALKTDGTVVGWGKRYPMGQALSQIQSQLIDIVDILDLMGGFIAVSSDNRLISWGQVYGYGTTVFPTTRYTTFQSGNTMALYSTFLSAALIQIPAVTTLSPSTFTPNTSMTITYSTNVQWKSARKFHLYGLYDKNGTQISTYFATEHSYTYTFLNAIITSITKTNLTIRDLTQSTVVDTRDIDVAEFIQLDAPSAPTIVSAVADNSTIHVQMSPPTTSGTGSLVSYMYSIGNESNYKTVSAQDYALTVNLDTVNTIATSQTGASNAMLQLFVNGNGSTLLVNLRENNTDASYTNVVQLAYSGSSWGAVSTSTLRLPYSTGGSLAVSNDFSLGAVAASDNVYVSDSITQMDLISQSHQKLAVNNLGISMFKAVAINGDNSKLVAIDGSGRVVLARWNEQTSNYDNFSVVFSGLGASSSIDISTDGQRIVFVNGSDVHYAIWNGTAFVDGGSIKGTALSTPHTVRFNANGNIAFCSAIENGKLVLYYSAWTGSVYTSFAATSLSITTTGTYANGLDIDSNNVIYLSAYGSANIYSVAYFTTNGITTAPNCFDITNLGTSDYTVYVKAVNSAGYYSSSVNTQVSISVPPEPPTITVITPLVNGMQIFFSQNNSNGSTITNCYYSVDTVNYVAMNSLQGLYTIADLSGGTPYIIRLRSVSNAGTSHYAQYSKPVIPLVPPPAPIVSSVKPSPTGVLVDVDQTPIIGGKLIGYEYTIDGGNTYISIISTPLWISGLTQDTDYSNMAIRVITDIGVSAPVIIPSVRTTSSTPPAPTITGLVVGNQSVTFTLSVGDLGGLTLTGYKYSLNSGSWVTVTTANQFFTVSSLVNGTTYTARMVTMADDVSSNIVTTAAFVPCAVPDAPTIDMVVPGNTNITVTLTNGASNGSPIGSYLYSIDHGSTFLPVSATNGSFVIPGLSNGTGYSVILKSVNAAGPSPPSLESAVVKPFGPPSAPTITEISPGDGCAYVTVDPGNTNGSPITKYQYSAGGAFIDISGAMPLRIPSLTNGKQYTITIISYTAAGQSSGSSSANVIPGTAKTPVISNITSSPKSLNVYFDTNIANNWLITQLYYTLNGGVEKVMQITGALSSPITISNLTNGMSYAVRIQCENENGKSLYSAPYTATPIDVPSAVIVHTASPYTPLSIAQSTTDATSIGSHSVGVVYFTPPNNNGSIITQYKYSLNRGAKQNTSYTSSPIYVPIPDNSSCVIRLYAVNEAGTSGDGNNAVTLTSVYHIPSTPNIYSTTALLNKIKVKFTLPRSNGSPITNYWYSLTSNVSPIPYTWYSLNINSTYTMLNNDNVDINGTVVTLTIPDVPNNVYNYVTIKAANAVGQSQPSILSNTILFPLKNVYMPPSQIPKVPLGTRDTVSSVTLRFNTPAANGSRISSYQYIYDSSAPSVNTVNVYTTTNFRVDYMNITYTILTIEGLPNASQSFRVRAVNDAGPSLVWSNASPTVNILTP